MKKDSGKSAPSQKRSSKGGFILERRRNPGSSPSDSQERGRNNTRRPLSVEAFQETVSRYCRRYKKDRRDFSLASVTVLEYKKASAQEREVLDKAIVSVLFKFLREEDRICFVQPAHYLVLMPSTIFDSAVIAMRRISEKIGATKVRRKATVLHPSAFVSVTSLFKTLSQTDTDAEAAVNSEALYSSIGYTIDSKGQITSLRDKEEEHQEPLFNGHVDGWMLRYSSQNERKSAGPRLMRDLWSNSFVEMRTIKVFNTRGDTITDGAYTGNLLRRLRVLQNLDLPGVAKLHDFYLSREGILILVNCPPRGIELTSGDFARQKQTLPFDVDLNVLSLWLTQVLTSMIALQALVPPVIPKTFDGVKLFCCPEIDGTPGGQIVMTDYDVDYLKAAVSAPMEVKSSPFHESETRCFLDGLLSFMVDIGRLSEDPDARRFGALIEGLDSASSSSPFKIRAQLKHLMEDEHA